LVQGTNTLTNTFSKWLPEGVALAYDENGNLLSDGLRWFEYNCENQLASVTVSNAFRSEFVYDGFGRRRVTRELMWLGGAWRLEEEVRYLWDGMLLMQERHYAGMGSDLGPVRTVTYTRGADLSGSRRGAGGIGGLLARSEWSITSPQPSTSYYLSDAGGNVTLMVDGEGEAVADYTYDPFGNLIRRGGTLGEANTIRFSSKEYHARSGLYYYGFRFYDPNLQRWLNEDPIGERGGINLHRFVGNSPLNAIDPYGEEIRLSEANGALQLPGPMSYATGDTVAENLASGLYNAIPLVGNGLSGAAGPILGGFSALDQASEGFLGWLTGDPQLAEGINNAIMLGPWGWGGDLARMGRASRCVKAAEAASEARGGTYLLRDPVTGQVMRTGRTGDLVRREAEHARDPAFRGFQFEPVDRTDVYSQQRGLEQLLHEKYNPSLDKINPISPANPSRQDYLDAAQQFLQGGNP
jgi:RHS repeat-associated protein